MDEDETDKGVKKVRDTGVFTVTSIFSMVAYGWMLYVLWDSYVELWEAIVTFALFWVVMACAYTADQINAKRTKERQADTLGKSGSNPLQKTNEDGNPSQVKSPEENIPFTAL
jgi:putative Mn2+ efflux pump MntP